jgi:predicted amidophosphoribosyltransferase
MSILDTPLCPACAATLTGTDDEQCAECGFEAGKPVVLLRQLFEAEPLVVDDPADWNDLRALARMVALATLDNPADVRRLLDGGKS